MAAKKKTIGEINSYVQVLLKNFELCWEDCGWCLKVDLDRDTPAIDDPNQKRRFVKAQLKKLKEKIGEWDRLIWGRLGGVQKALLRWQDEPSVCEIPEEDKPKFRFVSGGVLPILGIEEKEYYVFFWREIDPIGWNIANGGSESLEELLDPGFVIDREFAEELLLFSKHGDSYHRYDLVKGDGRHGHRVVPEARRAWAERLGNQESSKLKKATGCDLRVRWERGPDSVVVRYGKSDEFRSSDYYLNINAGDFGIEVDRVAKIHMPTDVRLGDLLVLDGEARPSKVLQKAKYCGLLDQVVGLFEVRRANRWFLSRDGGPLVPDLFFRTGESRMRNGKTDEAWEKELKAVMRVYMKETGRGPKKIENHHLGLCPVSNGIMSRYLGLRFSVFLSFHYTDMLLAQAVYDYLTEQGVKVYYYPIANRDNGYATVDESVKAGLEQAETLVALFTDPRNLNEKRPSNERKDFGAKVGNKRMFLFGPTSKVSANDIPDGQMRVLFSLENPKPGIRELANSILARHS